MKRYCSNCNSISTFNEHVMKKNGSKRCTACVSEILNKYNRRHNYVRRINKSIQDLCDPQTSPLVIRESDVKKLLDAFEHKCVISSNSLDRESVRFSHKPFIIPNVVGAPVRNLADLTVVSSAVSKQLTKQRRQRLEDKARCVIHTLESADVRDRIRAAHDRLERIEAAEKKLKDEEQGNASPTSPLSA